MERQVTVGTRHLCIESHCLAWCSRDFAIAMEGTPLSNEISARSSSGPTVSGLFSAVPSGLTEYRLARYLHVQRFEGAIACSASSACMSTASKLGIAKPVGFLSAQNALPVGPICRRKQTSARNAATSLGRVFPLSRSGPTDSTQNRRPSAASSPCSFAI